MIRERLAEIGGRPVRYLEAGAGWPVILLHAFPLDADMWRPQLEQVPDGWRFIAPDLAGFGPSAAAGAAPAGPLTMDDLSAGVEALMDHLTIDKGVIGGLSMGGYVTFALARRAPERFTGMVLADTKPQADTPEGRQARRALIAVAQAKGSAAVADQMLPKLLGPTTQATRPDVAAEVRRMIEAAPVEGIAGALEGMAARPDSTALLASIAWPTLVIAGAEDGITPPADAEAMDRAIPRSRLVIVPEAGHLASLEAPSLFSTALSDFLQSNI